MPHPGGPWRRKPLGGVTPRVRNTSGCFIWTSSLQTCSTVSSQPPMSENLTDDCAGSKSTKSNDQKRTIKKIKNIPHLASWISFSGDLSLTVFSQKRKLEAVSSHSLNLATLMTAMGFISCTLNRHKGYKPPAIYIHLLSWDQSEFIWQQWPSNQLGEFIDWGCDCERWWKLPRR